MDRKKKPVRSRKRRGIRFSADSGDFALIDLKPHGAFHPTTPALIMNESYKGCGLIVLASAKLEAGAHVKVRVGRLPILPATIVWKIDLDGQVVKIGLEYKA
jgi:hypothetical protein